MSHYFRYSHVGRDLVNKWGRNDNTLDDLIKVMNASELQLSVMCFMASTLHSNLEEIKTTIREIADATVPSRRQRILEEQERQRRSEKWREIRFDKHVQSVARDAVESVVRLADEKHRSSMQSYAAKAIFRYLYPTWKTRESASVESVASAIQELCCKPVWWQLLKLGPVTRRRFDEAASRKSA